LSTVYKNERTEEATGAVLKGGKHTPASLASSGLLYFTDKLVPHPIERAKEQRRPLALF